MRLLRLGADWRTRGLLVKRGVRHYLAPFGVAPRWTNHEVSLRLRWRRQTFMMVAWDDEHVISVFRHVFAEDHYGLGEWVGPCRTVVDLGANIGAFAVAVEKRFPDARLVCVEPESVNLSYLERNLALNAISATIVPAAVVADPDVGSVQLHRSFSATAHRVLPDALDDGHGVVVAACDLDRLFREHGLEHVDLLKCDIEGAETDLFAASPSTVLRMIDTIVVECHSELSARTVEDALTASFDLMGRLSWENAENQVLTFRNRKAL